MTDFARGFDACKEAAAMVVEAMQSPVDASDSWPKLYRQSALLKAEIAIRALPVPEAGEVTEAPVVTAEMVDAAVKASREAVETLAYVLPGLKVLRNMLAKERLLLGTEKADEMIQAIIVELKKHAAYPEFCHRPDQCALKGRCMSEIVCND